MIPPDDELPPGMPPIHDRETLDELPAANDVADTEPPSAPFGEPEALHTLPVIPAGQAQASFAAALDDLARAFALVEATGMAACRALDEQVTVGAP